MIVNTHTAVPIISGFLSSNKRHTLQLYDMWFTWSWFWYSIERSFKTRIKGQHEVMAIILNKFNPGSILNAQGVYNWRTGCKIMYTVIFGLHMVVVTVLMVWPFLIKHFWSHVDVPPALKKNFHILSSTLISTMPLTWYMYIRTCRLLQGFCLDQQLFCSPYQSQAQKELPNTFYRTFYNNFRLLWQLSTTAAVAFWSLLNHEFLITHGLPSSNLPGFFLTVTKR